MSVSVDPDGSDIVFSGFEQGIGVSPHKGIGNLQNINLNTLTGEALISFGRVQDTMTNSVATGSLAFADSSHVSLSIAGTNNLFKGNWIAVTNSSNTGELPNGTYYVPPSTGANFQLSNYYNNGISQPPVSIGVLAVGGGGAGGGGADADAVGGGGGGGQVLSTTTTVTQQSYSITIGAGGIGSASAQATDGGSSSFASVTAVGGGRGGGQGSSAGLYTPDIGSSGGGGYGRNTSTSFAGAAGTAGNSGGSSFSTGTLGVMAAGGGGGAGSIGGNGTSGVGGAGGNGTTPSIGGETYSLLGAGGGAGAVGTGGSVQGGSGAGGGGSSGAGGSATANSGAGGGGGGAAATGSSFHTGGNGGSGIVVIATPVNSFISVATTGTHTTSGGYDYWTFTSNGTWFPTLKTVSNNPFLTGFTMGLTANFTMVATMGKPIATTTQPETYYLNGVNYNRYYILDSNNLVWVYDTQNEITYALSDNVSWFLPDFQTAWCTDASGIAVISGWLFGTASDGAFAKPVVQLGNTASTATTWTQLPDIEGWSGIGSSTAIKHFCLTTKTGNLYITDASYIVGIFPDSAIADPGNSTSNNVQTLSSWIENSSTSGTYSVISGTSPATSDGKRLPVVFFTEPDGSLPTTISADTIFYIEANPASQTFSVYSSSTGGSALDLLDGASGTQYFNSFYPIAQVADVPTYVLTNPQVALPVFEIAQCMSELGTDILIGCVSNIIYPWNQQATQATTQIPLPESNTVQIITVHNMAYALAGSKGNIYITEGTTASLVTTVPSYTAGIPGSPETYIEPYFVWQFSMYLRGRIYFSILDQTASKAGNCGGVWSFIPTQNFYFEQDTGIAMRLENQNSYGTYNGAASVLIPKVNQQAVSPQYFSGWFSDITTPTYGIDSTGTVPNQTAILETELIPTGTILGQQKKTFTSEEYKLSSPLLSGESVQLNYRLDLTSAWKTCGTVNDDDSNMSGYFPINFQNSQWVQFQAVMTPNGTSTFSGNRLTEIRLHPSRYESN